MGVGDTFSVRQCIHLKLKHETYLAFRAEVERRSLWMQEVMEEFASQLVTGNPLLNRVLDDYEIRKAREQVEAVKNKDELSHHKKLTTANHETLFKLLEADSPYNQGHSKE